MLSIIISLIFAISCKDEQNAQQKNMTESQVRPEAPKARKIPKELRIHDDLRIDNYFWLNERDNQEVIDYLNEENAYYEAMTSHTREFQEDLFEEMKSRIKEDDESVPYRKNGYFYITRFEKDMQYPVYTRKKESLDAPEEIIVDVNELAEGYDYHALSGLNVSPDNSIAAFGIHTLSRRQYNLRLKNLETGKMYPEEI